MTSSGKIVLFHSSLVSVFDPWRDFGADTAPFKGTANLECTLLPEIQGTNTQSGLLN